MDSIVWVSIAALAAANTVFLLLLIAITRELGMILVRIGPTGVRNTTDGLSISETVESLEVEAIDGRTVRISATKFQPKLLAFLSPRCDACAGLVPALRTLASAYAGELTVVAISSGTPSPEDHAMADRLGPLVPYVCSTDLAQRFKIHTAPYVTLLDAENVVRAKGIANTLQHLESLLALEVRQFAGKPLPGLAEHTTAVGRIP